MVDTQIMEVNLLSSVNLKTDLFSVILKVIWIN